MKCVVMVYLCCLCLLSIIFSYNIAQDTGGGLFYYRDNTYCLIRDSELIGNTAEISGGGLNLNNYNHHFLVERTSFVENMVNLYGAGVAFGELNTYMVFTECTFYNNSAGFDGGAINIFSKNYFFTFLKCYFTHNKGSEGAALNLYTENAFIVVDDCDISHNIAQTLGAGVCLYSDNSDIQIRNSRISDNSAVSGGGIYLKEGNDDLLLEGCVIERNLASIAGSSSDGGGIYVDNYNHRMIIRQSLIVNNEASYEGGGIFVNSHNTNLTIEYTNFFNNFATRSGGAAFIFFSNQYLTLRNVTFSSNSVLTDGGALLIHTENTHMQILDSVFANNTSGDIGGAFSIMQQNSQLKFVNVVVKSNKAQGVGGGGYLWGTNTHVSFLNCSFLFNAALLNGGAIYIYRYNDFLCIEKSIFRSNQVLSDDGGALFFQLANTHALLSENLFDSNSAKTSGGAMALRSSNNQLRIENCVFLRNQAAYEGGALHFYVRNNNMTLINLLFELNSAVEGGALFLGQNHVVFALLDSIFVKNTAGHGGAVLLPFFAQDLLIEGCEFYRNNADSVGGMLVRSEAVVIRGTSFLQNTASNTAGLYLSSNEGLVENCTFYGNVATGFVAALLLGGSTNVVLTGLIFQDNLASFSSGGFGILDSSNISVQYTEFVRSNGADGGAMHLSFSYNISIQDSQFVDCSAVRGSAIEISFSDSIVIRRNNFTRNVARIAGAIYTMDSNYILASHNVFDSNIAKTGSGSALCIYGANETFITESVFLNNSAPSGAGTVYWSTFDAVEPFGLSNSSNTFAESNSAFYGPQWATEGVRLLVKSSENGVFHVNDYNKPVPVVVVDLVDFYDQRVETDSFSYVEVYVGDSEGDSCGSSDGYVSGGVLTLLDHGEANFTSLEATCAPGHNLTLELYLLNDNMVTFILPTTIMVTFRTCERGEFYQDSACQPCPIGTFGFLESKDLSDLQQTSVCQRCPDEASLCYADVIVLEQGYWRSHDTNDYILECPLFDSACMGGNTTSDSSCHAGYVGPLCAVCDKDYHFSALSQTCELCSNEASWFGPVLVSFSLVMLLGSLGWYMLRVKKRVGVDTFSDLLIYFCVQWGYISALDLNKAKKEWVTEYIRLKIIKRLQVRVRIYVTFYQILEILPFVLDLTFPSFYNVIGSMLSLLNLDISTDLLSATECSQNGSNDTDFIDRLLFSTIYPFGVLLLARLVLFIHIFLKRKGSLEELSPDVILSISAKYQKVCLVFISVILPGISSIIFATFSCTDVDSETPDESQVYMTVDYSVTCYSERYYFAFSWALVMIAVYPVGIPCYYLYLLYQHKDSIMTRDITASIRDNKLEGIKFLYEVYRPCYWYWEVVEMFFRLSMTALLVLLNQGSTLQIVIGILFALIFVKIYDIFLPYVDEEIKSVKEISLWQIFFIFAFAFGIKTKMLANASDGVIIVSLMMIIFSNLIIDFMKLCLVMFNIHKRRSQSSIAGRDDAEDVLSDYMSADSLDKEILTIQVKLAELSSIKKRRLEALWSVAATTDNNIPDDKVGASNNYLRQRGSSDLEKNNKPNDFVVSPLYRDSCLELSPMMSSNDNNRESKSK